MQACGEGDAELKAFLTAEMNVQIHPEATVLHVLLVDPRVAHTVMTKRNIIVPVENLIPVFQPAASYYIGSISSWGKIFVSSPSAQTGLGAHIASYTMDTTNAFLADKAAGA
jgi:hypothetical protein